MNEKTIALRMVRPGERFKLDGVEFVKLDDDKGVSFVLSANTLDFTCQFESEIEEREDRNNFSGSTLEKEMETWLRDKHKPIFDATVERPIDLAAMDGMTDYGVPLAVARTLTIDEYRKYRAHIPLTDEPYWLATAWATKSSPFSNNSYAYYVNTDGSLNNNNVYNANFAPRPALMDYRVQVPKGKAEDHHQRRLYPVVRAHGHGG